MLVLVLHIYVLDKFSFLSLHLICFGRSSALYHGHWWNYLFDATDVQVQIVVLEPKSLFTNRAQRTGEGMYGVYPIKWTFEIRQILGRRSRS